MLLYMQISIFLCIFVVACAYSEPEVTETQGQLTLDASPPDVDGRSFDTTWTCVHPELGCPWGPTLHNHALFWPGGQGQTTRLGYESSLPVYLPWVWATRVRIVITVGSATVYGGRSDQPTQLMALAHLTAGQAYHAAVGDRRFQDDSILSVESPTAFSWALYYDK